MVKNACLLPISIGGPAPQVVIFGYRFAQQLSTPLPRRTDSFEYSESHGHLLPHEVGEVGWGRFGRRPASRLRRGPQLSPPPLRGGGSMLRAIVGGRPWRMSTRRSRRFHRSSAS